MQTKILPARKATNRGAQAAVKHSNEELVLTDPLGAIKRVLLETEALCQPSFFADTDFRLGKQQWWKSLKAAQTLPEVFALFTEFKAALKPELIPVPSDL